MTIFAIGALLMADSALPVVLAGKVLFSLGLRGSFIGAADAAAAQHAAALQGRAFAAAEFALGVPQTLSIALGAGLVALVDYRFVLVVQAVTVGLAGIYLLTRMRDPWRPCSSLPPGNADRAPARWWRRSAPRP